MTGCALDFTFEFKKIIINWIRPLIWQVQRLIFLSFCSFHFFTYSTIETAPFEMRIETLKSLTTVPLPEMVRVRNAQLTDLFV